MFEQDYIMRLIHEIIRFLLKLVFHVDTESPLQQLVEEHEAKNVLEDLFHRLDDGDINGAENRLYELTKEDGRESLELALLFYSYLNDKDDGFLLEHDFSRKEIYDGLKRVTERFGYGGLCDLFLYERS